ncbi:phage tail tape measure protein [Microbacterium sp. BWR-S6Y]|uniref:phage tail tape measure protein n=1 Tax=Microbacterium sp. BWR-S6Y TaxID=3232073 RepID=UPI0035299EAD
MAKDFLIRIVGDASKGISELDRFARKADDLTHVGAAGMVMGGLIAAGVGIAVDRYAEFDQAMSNVVATGDDAKRSQEALRDAALDAGASTVFSATESANAIEELAKAGVSAEDTLAGGLNGALDLAAAGGLGVADAATIMATSMNQFSVSGQDATHVADLLAAGAGKAQGDVSDMSFALAQAGLVANATGLSIEETTGGLSAFASAGLLGSDAGTSFKAMLQRLTPQSAEAQRVMDELGISAYDAGGNFIGLANFAGNLQSSLRSLTPEQRQSALATIFGSDAVRAATILYNQGADGIRKWTGAVDEQGYAANVARTRLDNLRGDIEELGGAIDTALIQSGSGANDSLRALTSTAAGAVSWFGELPAPLQQAGLYLGIAAAAVGLFGGAATVGVPKVMALKTAVEGTSLSMRGLSLAAGGVTIGLAAVIAIVAAAAAEQAKAEARAQAYADTLEQGTRRVTTATREMAKETLAAQQSWMGIDRGSTFTNAEKLGLSLDTVTDAALGQVAALEELSGVLKAGQGDHIEAERLAQRLGLSLAEVSAAATSVSQGVLGSAGSLEQAMNAARQKEAADKSASAASRDSANVADSAAASYLAEADRIEQVTKELDNLIDSVNEANGVGQDAVTTNARWKDSLAGISGEVQKQREEYERANGSLDGYSLSLDEHTAAGSANAAMLASVASDAQAAAKAQYELDVNTVGAQAAAESYARNLGEQRSAFEEAARAAGFNADEVQRLADKVFALPPSRTVDLIAETGTATQRVQDFAAMWAGIQSKTISLNAVPLIGGGTLEQSGPFADGYRFAGGGEVRGPGTRTSDSIAAWLSDEEFVVNADAAQKNKGLLSYINAGGEVRAYADGMLGVASASGAPTVRMIPLAGSAGEDAGAVNRRAIQEDVRTAIAAAISARPEGTREYHFPPGVTAEQLVRAMDEDIAMNMRLG